MRIYSAASALPAHPPPMPKSTLLTMLSLVLLVPSIDSPLLHPCSSSIEYTYKGLGRLERKLRWRRLRLHTQRVDLRWGVCIPAVSPLEQQDRQNVSDRTCACSSSWYAAILPIVPTSPPIIFVMPPSTLQDSLAAGMLCARSATPSPPSA
jgi:hypothetical protein